jgi:hypothetical protein
VRSSQSHFVKASGLRWLSLMLLTPIPWAKRVWALPFLTALAPSERYYEGRRRKHKKLTDWARQMLFQVRRWLPGRQLVVVADASFAVIELLWQMTRLANPICMITRFRLDAALYEPAPPRTEGQKGRPPQERLPPAYPGEGIGRRENWLEAGYHSRLVWGRSAQGGNRFCNCGLVPGMPSLLSAGCWSASWAGSNRALLCTDLTGSQSKSSGSSCAARNHLP